MPHAESIECRLLKGHDLLAFARAFLHYPCLNRPNYSVPKAMESQVIAPSRKVIPHSRGIELQVFVMKPSWLYTQRYTKVYIYIHILLNTHAYIYVYIYIWSRPPSLHPPLPPPMGWVPRYHPPFLLFASYWQHFWCPASYLLGLCSISAYQPCIY